MKVYKERVSQDKTRSGARYVSLEGIRYNDIFRKTKKLEKHTVNSNSNIKKLH